MEPLAEPKYDDKDDDRESRVSYCRMKRYCTEGYYDDHHDDDDDDDKRRGMIRPMYLIAIIVLIALVGAILYQRKTYKQKIMNLESQL